MAKRLKLRISRAITSSFHSCRSKEPSVSNPIPSFFRFSPNPAVAPPPPPPSAVKPDHFSAVTPPQLFQWQNKEEEWQLVYHNSPPPPLATHKKKKITRRHKKKKAATDNIALFSSEEKERGETSRSFSSDSSEFPPIREKPRKMKKKKKRGGCVTNGMCRLSISSSPARLSVFKKLIPTAVEGKVRDSFAVVKKSEDPYEDFKQSMMDMIWEKQMFEEGDLEQLLECFLSLNSPRHHKIIVDAFAEIWNGMFSNSNTTGTTSTARNSNAFSGVDCERTSSLDFS